ncbi:MAG: hypothetical protein HY815_31810 [Candidatus Riflebacteria bacterium]|nr:hypothetical protein [Candidatus Riflebacteria bacterium]
MRGWNTAMLVVLFFLRPFLCGAEALTPKQELEHSLTSPDVVEDLKTPNGPSFKILPDGNWQLLGQGSAGYDTSDADEAREAEISAAATAKSNLITFLQQQIDTDEVVTEIFNKTKRTSTMTPAKTVVTEKSKAMADGKASMVDTQKSIEATPAAQGVSIESIKSRAKWMRTSASQVVSGLLTLETRKIPRAGGVGGDVTVVVGVSSKSMALAKSIKLQMDKPLPQDGSGPGGGRGQGENKGDVRRTTSDF